jgi:methyl-accepting chemotaxis protein
MAVPSAYKAGLNSYEIDAETIALRRSVWRVLDPHLSGIVDRHIDLIARSLPRYETSLRENSKPFRELVLHYTERLFLQPFDEQWIMDAKKRVQAEIELGHDMRTRGGIACSILVDFQKILMQKRFYSKRKALRLLDTASRVLQMDVANSTALHYNAEVRNAKSSTEAFDQAIQNFDHAIHELLRILGVVANSLVASSQQLASIASRASDQANAAVHTADKTALHVEAVAAGAEQLKASISTLHQQADASAGKAGQAAQAAVSAADAMTALSQAVAEIDSTLAAISDVAEQTNLLALNATIEAARAGTSGRGFGVVAAEVKSLAAHTHKLTEAIESKIQIVQNASRQSVAQITETEDNVRQIANIAQSVAIAVNEQASATANIAIAASSAAADTATTANVLRCVEEVIRDAQISSSALVGMSQDLLQRASEMNKALESLFSAAAQHRGAKKLANLSAAV